MGLVPERFEIKVERDRTYELALMYKVHRFIAGYMGGTEFEPTEYTAETYQEIF